MTLRQTGCASTALRAIDEDEGSFSHVACLARVWSAYYTMQLLSFKIYHVWPVIGSLIDSSPFFVSCTLRSTVRHILCRWHARYDMFAINLVLIMRRKRRICK